LLRPAGKAEIDGRVVDVVSDGGMIAAGSLIEVVHASQNRIVVREAESRT
jgi:membrane-bound serine protease (ClpP class)